MIITRFLQVLSDEHFDSVLKSKRRFSGFYINCFKSFRDPVREVIPDKQIERMRFLLQYGGQDIKSLTFATVTIDSKTLQLLHLLPNLENIFLYKVSVSPDSCNEKLDLSSRDLKVEPKNTNVKFDLPKLRDLYIRDCNSMAQDVFHNIPKNVLRQGSLYCRPQDDEIFIRNLFINQRNLERLTVSVGENEVFKSLVRSVSNFPKLIYLRLTWMDERSSNVIDELASTSIKTLEISRLADFNSSTVISLVRNLPQLENLDVMSLFSPNIINVIIEHFHRLKRLRLQHDCDSHPTEPLIVRDNLQHESLTELIFRVDHQLLTEGFFKLVGSLKNLKLLETSFLTDAEGIKSILTIQPNLEKLELYCSCLSLEIIQILKTEGKKLGWVKINFPRLVEGVTHELVLLELGEEFKNIEICVYSICANNLPK